MAAHQRRLAPVGPLGADAGELIEDFELRYPAERALHGADWLLFTAAA